MVDVRHETRGHRRPDDEARQTTAALRLAATLILMYLLVGAVADQMTGDVGHTLREDQIHTLGHVPELHHTGGIAIVHPLGHGDAAIAPADLQPHHVVDIVGTGAREV